MCQHKVLGSHCEEKRKKKHDGVSHSADKSMHEYVSHAASNESSQWFSRWRVVIIPGKNKIKLKKIDLISKSLKKRGLGGK